jgi:transposase
VITHIRTPDYSTIAEFRRRHETEIGEPSDDLLGLCREAGLVSVGVITIDGTKIKANTSMDTSRLSREILRGGGDRPARRRALRRRAWG